MERKKIVFLAEVAILAALILLMSFTPLGYLRLPGLSVSLLMIPVAIGAVVVGPAAGAILGCLFGLTSFAQCFMGDVLGGILVAENVFFAFVVCVVSRTLAGLLCGLIFKAFKGSHKVGPVLVANLAASLLNTLLFLGFLALLYFNLSFTPEQVEALGGLGSALTVVIVTATSINAPIELALCGVVGTAVSKAVLKINSSRLA